uniref:Thioredoxin domain-containing protein n=1 Tax=Ditylum brightwellii TaxID=49249 RepID=A0A7S1ZUF1_9STRA|mmetsp:Transcript_39095/g.58721  ORF Transcript_39095/g.58721 Transcript_39095/m.58721 type:complete len:226 (+) Transcript_39095:25-702(+)
MKFSISAAAIFAALTNTAEGAVTSLNFENYDELTAGKVIFVKFFAPWCGHCKAMAASWETLAEEWAGNDSALIAEVDCTDDEAADLCEIEGVEGYPTVKYGDPAMLENYDGERSLDALSAFARKNLKPTCSPSHLELCSDEEKATIDKIQAMSLEELEDAIKTVVILIEELEDNADTEIERLQSAYEEILEELTWGQKHVKKKNNYSLLMSTYFQIKRKMEEEEL